MFKCIYVFAAYWNESRVSRNKANPLILGFQIGMSFNIDIHLSAFKSISKVVLQN